jgi:hypothetical protein
MSFQSSSEAAKRCPAESHVAQVLHDGRYYCTPAHPGGAVGQVLGHAVAVPIVVILALSVGAARQWVRARKAKA